MSFKSSRLHQPQWLSGALHFVILAFAFDAESAEVWPYALIVMSAVSFVAWAANYRRYRQISDLPTSRVASAAQGYVELFGRAELLPGAPVTSRLSRSPCCWYSYTIEEQNQKDEWRTVDSGCSVEQFLLIDSSGRCVVSPDGAEVLTNDYNAWSEGRRRYSECLLLPASALYAIGEFSTATAAAPTAREENADVGALLNEWKRDPDSLRARFDLDRDGAVDLREWELARLQARREVRKRQTEMQSAPAEGVHLLRKPGDGRLFLLANELPDKLGARYRFWSLAHLAAFLAAGTAGLLML